MRGRGGWQAATGGTKKEGDRVRDLMIGGMNLIWVWDLFEVNLR